MLICACKIYQHEKQTFQAATKLIHSSFDISGLPVSRYLSAINERGHLNMSKEKKKPQNHAFSRLCALDPRSSSDHTPLSCQSLGHSEQMLAQPAGHGDLETISKGVFFGSVGTQLPPTPGNGDPAQRGLGARARGWACANVSQAALCVIQA